MSKNVILSDYDKHPSQKGIYMKHFFSSEDNDRLNNLEVRIEAGCEISPHTHDNSNEFYYVVSGSGMFLIENEWVHIRAGEAMKAPMNVEHGFKNNTSEPLILFSTFSPPIK